MDTETPLQAPRRGSALFVIAGIFFALLIGGSLTYWLAASAPKSGAPTEQVVLPLGTTAAKASALLQRQGVVRRAWAFDLILRLRGISVTPGGYSLSPSQNAWQIASALAQPPALAWVVIPEGLRKEEIAGILQKTLGWSDAQKAEWVSQDTGGDNPAYKEGVYFPDTYLIPRSEAPLDVAHRLQHHFEEIFQPYLAEAYKQNEKWTTVVKVASLIEREAAGPSDMPLISGIIWNRLLKNMPLDIDATIQYARGDKGAGFWAPPIAGDKSINSPYNTYLHKGLPPSPIANPGLSAIKAALFPATTTCLYYLHDSSGQIHCSDTYQGQLDNIQKYLK